MVKLNGWEIDLGALPGYESGWGTVNAELFAIPGSHLAFVAYDIGEIGVVQCAGYLAVYRNQNDPTLIFCPRSWMVSPSPHSVQCNRDESVLLIYVANVRERQERYAIVHLDDRRFAWVFIPNSLYQWTFAQTDTHHFSIVPPSGSTPTVSSEYVIDARRLRWSDFGKSDGYDDMIASQSNQ